MKKTLLSVAAALSLLAAPVALAQGVSLFKKPAAPVIMGDDGIPGPCPICRRTL